MKRKLSVLFTAAALVASALVAQGPTPPPPMRGPGGHGIGPGPGPRPGEGRLADALGLTDAQKAQWTTIRGDFATTLDPLFEKQRAADQALNALFEAKSSDACAVGTAALAARAVHEQIEAAHATLDEKLASVLTADQQTKFAAIRAEREKGPGGRMPPPPRM
jgi:Spy/CpxP family protein refolding chaperone